MDEDDQNEITTVVNSAGQHRACYFGLSTDRMVIVLFVVSVPTKASIKTDTRSLKNKIILKTKTDEIFGTSMGPTKFENILVALLIAGSDPTDPLK